MDLILEEALKEITSRTNLSTGLSHPNDKNAAKEMFKILHNAGIILVANEISDWAKMNSWRKKDADELGTLAQQIGMGKNVIIKDSWWRENILEILNEKINSNKNN